jgi:hypothetical protein
LSAPILPHSMTIVLSVPPHERGVSSVTGAGRDAVAGGRGAKTYAQSNRRPKLCGPGAPAARHSGLFSGGAVPRLLTGRFRRSPPKRWIGAVSNIKEAEPERSVHRGPRRASLKHRVRDAGRPADLRFCEFRYASVP